MGGSSLLGQATCNSRVGPLMSLEKDFVGGGANTGANTTLLEERVNLEKEIKEIF